MYPIDDPEGWNGEGGGRRAGVPGVAPATDGAGQLLDSRLGRRGGS